MNPLDLSEPRKQTSFEDNMGSFDWVNLQGGRARFSGGVRGWDEKGHETFAVELDGTELFGEFGTLFSGDEKSYRVEILSFGYKVAADVGVPAPDARDSFDSSRIDLIKQLVTDLIKLGVKGDDRPFPLCDPKEHALDGVDFLDGWIRETP